MPKNKTYKKLTGEGLNIHLDYKGRKQWLKKTLRSA